MTPTPGRLTGSEGRTARVHDGWTVQSVNSYNHEVHLTHRDGGSASLPWSAVELVNQVWAAFQSEGGYHPPGLIGLASTRDGAKALCQARAEKTGRRSGTQPIVWNDDPYEGEGDTADRISKGGWDEDDDTWIVQLTEVAFS